MPWISGQQTQRLAAWEAAGTPPIAANGKDCSLLERERGAHGSASSRWGAGQALGRNTVRRQSVPQPVALPRCPAVGSQRRTVGASGGWREGTRSSTGLPWPYLAFLGIGCSVLAGVACRELSPRWDPVIYLGYSWRLSLGLRIVSTHERLNVVSFRFCLAYMGIKGFTETLWRRSMGWPDRHLPLEWAVDSAILPMLPRRKPRRRPSAADCRKLAIGSVALAPCHLPGGGRLDTTKTPLTVWPS